MKVKNSERTNDFKLQSPISKLFQSQYYQINVSIFREIQSIWSSKLLFAVKFVCHIGLIIRLFHLFISYFLAVSPFLPPWDSKATDEVNKYLIIVIIFKNLVIT